MQLHQPSFLEQLTALQGSLLVLSFAKMERLQSWIPHFQENFLKPYYQEQQGAWPTDIFARTRFLADPDLTAYHAYGLGQNRPEEVYSRAILRQYVRWRAQGKPVQPPQEDPLQRGGNFVVNREGRITLAHSGRDQSERPSVAAILASMQA